MPLTTTFYATDLNGQMVVRKPTIEGLMAWLHWNKYFENNPEQILTLSETFTISFEMKITPETNVREALEAWRSFNGYM